jgi:hypothetical protein
MQNWDPTWRIEVNLPAKWAEVSSASASLSAGDEFQSWLEVGPRFFQKNVGIINFTTTASFRTPSNSLFSNNYTIQSIVPIAWAAASINKPSEFPKLRWQPAEWEQALESAAGLRFNITKCDLMTGLSVDIILSLDQTERWLLSSYLVSLWFRSQGDATGKVIGTALSLGRQFAKASLSSWRLGDLPLREHSRLEETFLFYWKYSGVLRLHKLVNSVNINIFSC